MNCTWCGEAFGKRWWQGVPNTGDLCDECHDLWLMNRRGAMTANEFQQKCFRTERQEKIGLSVEQARLLHGAIGLASEAGELLDSVKAHLYYGRNLDATNVLEECGDALWFISIALDSCGYTLEQAMAMNVAKLAARYPEGFSEDKANHRDLGLERTTLESKHHCTENGGCKAMECDR